MFIFLIRTTILYALVVIVIRLMGKRQIGELEPFELVVTIMISDLASLPMQDARLPLINGVIPILTLLFIQILLSEVEIKSKVMRNVLDGKPTILIKDGKVDTNQLSRQRLSLSELLEELRIQGCIDVNDIAYAIWETNGQLSVIKKSENGNNIFLPKVIYFKGELYEEILQAENKTVDWFEKQLNDNKLKKDDLDFALIDCKGKFQYQRKENNS
ncbi:DUF421 domain-containing protein [Clostridium frigidicarnis]|uniref:Uncharacterized membrane protein YcaP, DUF421 family n=1 Tax=Clostridium frigidicarnis TaxID=84698 RepID=A0A1I1ADH2_9CLOT|nr:YetF domain-containing protein [Clostridium frigidicarnis]SFB36034.1 Uncharacterized membrane protein YcaP, DUF421 family [Clostridium frigidicarnis]